MTNTQGADGAPDRLRVERLLARYPAIATDELGELLHWFRKEASALDVGMIASDPSVGESYRRFSKDHLDRLTVADIIKALALMLAVAAAMAGLIWASL